MPKPKPKPEYADAAERFVALVAARRVSKARLSRESGYARNKLDHYEKGQRAPGDVFRTNSEFVRLARAIGLLPSALIAWWAFGEDIQLPAVLMDEIERFRALPEKDKIEALKLLGWGLPRGGHRKKAPPRAP